MKKCLFISTIHSVFKEPVQEAFQRAGFDVRFIDYRGHPFLVRDSIMRRVVTRLPLGMADRAYQYAERWVNQKVIQVGHEYQPDIIFVIKAKELAKDTLALLKKIAPTANWYPETIDHWGGIITTAPHYTYFFTFDQIVIDRLRQEGIHKAYYLPFCADVAPHAPWPQEKKEPVYNVTFVGSYHPVRSDREHILAKIAHHGLHIWGNKAWEQTSLKQYYHGPISNADMLDVYRSSRMVINHYITDLPGSGINLRPFEVTGAGALLINHDERSDIFRHFRDGEEFVSFHGVDDIAQKVAYYMEHDRERRRIARNGFLRTQHDHTYDIRIASALATMDLSQ